MRTMLKVFAVMLLTVLAAGHAWAKSLDIPLKVQFSLNTVVQEASSGTAPIVKYNTSKKTIHSSDIIDLIGVEVGHVFSDKARLWYHSGADRFSVTDGPSVTVDVTTTLLSLTLDDTNLTAKGKRNTDTDKYDVVYHMSATITYGPDKAGNYFTLTGSDANQLSTSFTKSSKTTSRSMAISPISGNGRREGSKYMQIIGGSVHMEGKLTEKLP